MTLPLENWIRTTCFGWKASISRCAKENVEPGWKFGRGRGQTDRRLLKSMKKLTLEKFCNKRTEKLFVQTIWVLLVGDVYVMHFICIALRSGVQHFAVTWVIVLQKVLMCAWNFVWFAVSFWHPCFCRSQVCQRMVTTNCVKLQWTSTLQDPALATMRQEDSSL